jgi:hypothetical protein
MFRLHWFQQVLIEPKLFFVKLVFKFF